MPWTRGFSLRKHIVHCVSRKLLNLMKINPKFTRTGLKSGYVPIADDEGKRVVVPKGHMAVYIGREDGEGGELRRVLVPVVYFNHPLFGELLREAEEEYGFCQEGGITIPCRVSEFERVRTCVASVSHGRSGIRGRKALLRGCS